jgi:hypothetical protein
LQTDFHAFRFDISSTLNPSGIPEGCLQQILPEQFQQKGLQQQFNFNCAGLY